MQSNTIQAIIEKNKSILETLDQINSNIKGNIDFLKNIKNYYNFIDQILTKYQILFEELDIKIEPETVDALNIDGSLFKPVLVVAGGCLRDILCNKLNYVKDIDLFIEVPRIFEVSKVQNKEKVLLNLNNYISKSSFSLEIKNELAEEIKNDLKTAIYPNAIYEKTIGFIAKMISIDLHQYATNKNFAKFMNNPDLLLSDEKENKIFNFQPDEKEIDSYSVAASVIKVNKISKNFNFEADLVLLRHGVKRHIDYFFDFSIAKSWISFANYSESNNFTDYCLNNLNIEEDCLEDMRLKKISINIKNQYNKSVLESELKNVEKHYEKIQYKYLDYDVSLKENKYEMMIDGQENKITEELIENFIIKINKWNLENKIKNQLDLNHKDLKIKLIKL